MTGTIVLLNSCFTGEKPSNNTTLAVVAFDFLASTLSLIIGILGATAVITMPPAAAYSLIGVSGFIVLAWIAMVMRCKYLGN